MKQDFELGQDYLMKIMGNYFQAPENDTMLIRFDVSNFKYRNSYSTSWHEPTDAQKLAYVYVGVVLTTTRQINFYFYDSRPLCARYETTSTWVVVIIKMYLIILFAPNSKLSITQKTCEDFVKYNLHPP